MATRLDALFLQVILIEVFVEDVKVHGRSVDEAHPHLVLGVQSKVNATDLLPRCSRIASDLQFVLQPLAQVGYLLKCLHLLVNLQLL